MRDHYANLFAAAADRDESAKEAWDSIKKTRERVEWNPNSVRVDDPEDEEFRFKTAASDD